MKRLLRIRRHRPLPEVEARIALLSEELPLTALFVAAMHRDGRSRAAIGVIEEQRDSLRRAQSAMLTGFGSHRRRVQAALAGAVAAVMLASGSYATVRYLRPDAPRSAELIQRATQTLAEANRAETASDLAKIVDEVRDTIVALPEEAKADPDFRLDVAQFLGQAQSLLASEPDASDLLAKIAEVAKEASVEVPDEQPGPSVAPAPSNSQP